MRKKLTQKEQRIGQEKVALESVLRDLALGANHGYDLDEEPGLFGAFGPKELGGFLGAVARRFELGQRASDDDRWEIKHALDFCEFEHFDTIETFAAHLHDRGVRE